jgi:cytochrome c2
MARDLVISHGVPGMGARKVLAGENLQASCYRCHDLKPLPGAQIAWEGFELFSMNACDTCHNVDGLVGGRYGPDLSEVGSFLGLKQIQVAIEDPKADPENSIMPKFSLSPGQINSLSYFLKSRAKESFYETPMVKMTRIKDQARAREKAGWKVAASGIDILREKKCLACHKFEKEDGQIGPDLTYMAYMRKEDYIKNFLYEPGKEIPGAIMPWISMTQQEEERVVQSLRQKGMENHLHGMSAKHLYMMLCQRCHAAQGDGFGTIQPNMANFPRAFWKNAEFFRRIPDARIVESIERGIPGTSMPPYGDLLGHEAINPLIDLIFREFIRIKRDDKRSDLTIPPKPAVILSLEKTGKVYARQCSSCHGVAGTGKGPEYLKYYPRPRDLTNRPYFRTLSDERIALAVFYGVPGTSMSPFSEKISGETLWSLVAKIRELSGTQEKTGQANG